MIIPGKLLIISYLAPNWFDFYQAVTAYLGRVCGLETEIHQATCDPLEDPLLLKDQIDLAFICGLPLVRYCQVVSDQLQTLVAPVMTAPRYQNRPIYFADVIVNADSDAKVFADFSGKIFCYNDLGSNSGYNLLWQHLINQGYPQDFFGQMIQSGSHQRSIRWVVEGKADCAAIDSIVLEQEIRNFPELSQQIRVVEVLKSCPIPPLVVAKRLGKFLIQEMQLALLQPDAELQAVMEKFDVKRFALINLADYRMLIPSSPNLHLAPFSTAKNSS